MLTGMLWGGCVSIYFNRYPGEALNEIPGKFQGNFSSKSVNETDNFFLLYEMDTVTGLMETNNKYEIRNDGWKILKKNPESYTLCDTVVSRNTRNTILSAIRPSMDGKRHLSTNIMVRFVLPPLDIT